MVARQTNSPARWGGYIKFLGALIRIHLDPEMNENEPN